MNMLDIDFDELYRRHLCRHSQYGINVLHIVAVAAIYGSLMAIALAIPGGRWVGAVMLAAYLVVLAANLPFRLWLATLAAVGLIAAAALAIPTAPIWLHALLIVFWHKFQVWSHAAFNHSHAMDEFADKYRKGPVLFLLLSLYELPLLMQYLLFGPRPAADASIAASQHG